MRNILKVITIIDTFISIILLFGSGYNSAYAQEIQNSSNSEPNERNPVIKALKERIEQLDAEYLQKHPEEVNKPKVVHPNEFDIEKMMARQIEADNIRYKNRVFGNPFCGLAMSIEPTKDEYKIGEDIEISIIFRNFSNGNLKLRWTRFYGDIRDFSYTLYFPNGTPVPKSELIEKYEANINKPSEFPRTGSDGFIDVRPKQIYSFINEVSRYFKIEKEGIYYLVIMRNITGKWQDGFMISNMIKIKIVDKKDE